MPDGDGVGPGALRSGNIQDMIAGEVSERRHVGKSNDLSGMSANYTRFSVATDSTAERIQTVTWHIVYGDGAVDSLLLTCVEGDD